MELSIKILKRELSNIQRRVSLIRKGDIKVDRGISLKKALLYKKDLESAIAELEKAYEEKG